MSLNSFHIYVPEGQGVLVGLEDPKDRVALVSEMSSVVFPFLMAVTSMSLFPADILQIFDILQHLPPQTLLETGGGPILSISQLSVHLSAPGPFLLHPLLPCSQPLTP